VEAYKVVRSPESTFSRTVVSLKPGLHSTRYTDMKRKVLFGDKRRIIRARFRVSHRRPGGKERSSQ
jgi:hypothetical protein